MTCTRTVVTGLAVLAAAGSLAACSGSGDPAPGSSSPTTPETVTSTARTTVTTSPSRAAQPGSAAVTRGGPCAESQLRASVKAVDVGLENYRVIRLTFANISRSTCTLTGYPGAAIEDSANRQVQQAKRTVGGPVGGSVEKVRTVTLRPGGSAYAWLEGRSTREVGAAQAGCDAPKYPRILVTPPNTDTPVPFTIGWPQCHRFDVHPVRVD